jgi:hypothetical protein
MPKVIKFPTREMGLGIAVIAVVAVAVAMGLGLFNPVMGIASKAGSFVKGIFGKATGSQAA